MRAAIAARWWLRAHQIPSYAPKLNPVEKVWSTMKDSLANMAVQAATELATAVKNRLTGCSTAPV
jgi:transposase